MALRHGRDDNGFSDAAAQDNSEATGLKSKLCQKPAGWSRLCVGEAHADMYSTIDRCVRLLSISHARLRTRASATKLQDGKTACSSLLWLESGPSSQQARHCHARRRRSESHVSEDECLSLSGFTWLESWQGAKSCDCASGRGARIRRSPFKPNIRRREG